jgi:hypothetical protein
MDYPEDATPRRLETGCEARVFTTAARSSRGWR